MSGGRLRDKLCTADEAVALINDGVTVVSGGFVGAAHPEALTAAMERRFKKRGTPTRSHAGLRRRPGRRQDPRAESPGPRRPAPARHRRSLGPGAPAGPAGDREQDRSLQLPAGRHLPSVARHRRRPAGLHHARRPGDVHRPDPQGGRLNARTPAGLVERIELGGKTWLWYKAFPIHVGLIRATAADPQRQPGHGRRGDHRRGARRSPRPCTTAAASSSPRSRDLLDAPAPPQHVRVPGHPRGSHRRRGASRARADLRRAVQPVLLRTRPGRSRRRARVAGDLGRADAARRAADHRRRACDELPDGAVANLGIGMPEGVARIAAERGLLQRSR